MKNLIKVAFLSSVITAALVYVILEWKPLQTVPSEPPAVSLASSPAAPSPGAGPVSDDEKNNIEVYQKYSPGVVYITSTTLTYDFFLQPVPQSGTGSGAIIDTQGNIVTNYHVIEGATRGGIEVTLADKTKVPASVVGADPDNDLAVLKIQTKSKLTPIPLGSSSGLQVGQKVLAIGNPFGLARTLTTGIISSLGRAIEAENGRRIEDIIQTDAAINPGNSGGPLLNSAGEIIGINAAIYSQSGGSNGIGFAIPADTVRRIVADLISVGYVRRPFVGTNTIAFADYPGLAAALGVNTGDTGLMVINVQPNSPAARAGVHGSDRTVIVGRTRVPTGGDVILAIDGRTIGSAQDLPSVIDRHKPGDKITITVLRGDRRMDLPVTLQEAPPPER